MGTVPWSISPGTAHLDHVHPWIFFACGSHLQACGQSHAWTSLGVGWRWGGQEQDRFRISCTRNAEAEEPTKKVEEHHCLVRSASVFGIERVRPSNRTHASASIMARVPPLVDVRHLQRNLAKLAVVDASWHMPGSERDARKEFRRERVPKARFFDVDRVKDRRSDLPHMLPPPRAFHAAMKALDLVQPDQHLVVYDALGVFSAPRMWYACKVMGYERVSVLDGGLPAYKRMGGTLETNQVEEQDLDVHVDKAMEAQSEDEGSKDVVHGRVASLEDVRRAIDLEDVQYIDARSRPRFAGDVPEPRAGLRRGHVPGSFNVPFDEMLQADGTYKSTEELQRVFAQAGVDMDKKIIVGCGTGVTACVVALGLEVLGHQQVAVYDGSWTEWASRDDTPIAKGTA